MNVIVVGSGIAGLVAALELSGAHRVTLVTKSRLAESNTRYAQGGIAAVMTSEDRIEEHVADTLVAAVRKPLESSALKALTASATLSALVSPSIARTVNLPKAVRPPIAAPASSTLVATPPVSPLKWLLSLQSATPRSACWSTRSQLISSYTMAALAACT